MREDVKVEVAKMISKEFGEKELDVHLTRIEACIQHKHLITVYELSASTTMDIDGAILHALLKGDYLYVYLQTVFIIICQLRAKRVLMLLNNVLLRTRRGLLPWTLYSINTCLALNWRYFHVFIHKITYSCYSSIHVIIHIFAAHRKSLS